LDGVYHSKHSSAPFGGRKSDPADELAQQGWVERRRRRIYNRPIMALNKHGAHEPPLELPRFFLFRWILIIMEYDFTFFVV
jgi:hypothetical protein